MFVITIPHNIYYLQRARLSCT